MKFGGYILLNLIFSQILDALLNIRPGKNYLAKYPAGYRIIKAFGLAVQQIAGV